MIRLRRTFMKSDEDGARANDKSEVQEYRREDESNVQVLYKKLRAW